MREPAQVLVYHLHMSLPEAYGSCDARIVAIERRAKCDVRKDEQLESIEVEHLGCCDLTRLRLAEITVEPQLVEHDLLDSLRDEERPCIYRSSKPPPPNCPSGIFILPCL